MTVELIYLGKRVNHDGKVCILLLPVDKFDANIHPERLDDIASWFVDSRSINLPNIPGTIVKNSAPVIDEDGKLKSIRPNGFSYHRDMEHTEENATYRTHWQIENRLTRDKKERASVVKKLEINNDFTRLMERLNRLYHMQSVGQKQAFVNEVVVQMTKPKKRG